MQQTKEGVKNKKKNLTTQAKAYFETQSLSVSLLVKWEPRVFLRGAAVVAAFLVTFLAVD